MLEDYLKKIRRNLVVVTRTDPCNDEWLDFFPDSDYFGADDPLSFRRQFDGTNKVSIIAIRGARIYERWFKQVDGLNNDDAAQRFVALTLEVANVDLVGTAVAVHPRRGIKPLLEQMIGAFDASGVPAYKYTSVETDFTDYPELRRAFEELQLSNRAKVKAFSIYYYLYLKEVLPHVIDDFLFLLDSSDKPMPARCPDGIDFFSKYRKAYAAFLAEIEADRNHPRFAYAYETLKEILKYGSIILD